MNSNTFRTDPAALRAFQRGWAPLPIPKGSKNPGTPGWQKIKYPNEEAVTSAFGKHEGNLGVLLGEPSGGLVDVDLDDDYAVKAARHVLSQRTLRSGRAVRPDSHYWFRCPVPQRITWTDVDKTMLVEIRTTGQQTVISPSIHDKDGDRYRWENGEDTEAEEISLEDLEVQAGTVALVSLLARHWPSSGSRHEAYVALAGALLREGAIGEARVSPVWRDRAGPVIGLLAAITHDRDGVDSRIAESVPTTIRRIEQGKPVQGFPALGEFIGLEVSEQAREFVRRIERAEGHDRGTYTAQGGLETAPGGDVPQDSPEGLEGAFTEAENDEIRRLVQQEVKRMKIRALAQQEYEDQTNPVQEILLDTAAEVLEQELPHAPRVDRLIPWNADTLVMAQRKTGKTMLCINLAHSMITGEKFLGEFDVIPVERDRCVVYLNFEVEARELAENVRDRGTPTDRFRVLNLRHKDNPMATKRGRAKVAQALRAVNAEAVIVDPFADVFTGESENDAAEVNAWLKELSRWVREDCGARDLVLVAHKGKNAQGGARGSSSLEAWYSTGISLDAKDPDDPQSSRLISARCRSRRMGLSEHEIVWDEDTCTMTLGADTSTQVTIPAPEISDDDVRDVFTAVLADQAGVPLSNKELETAVRDRVMAGGDKLTWTRVADLRTQMVVDGAIILQRGGRGAGGGTQNYLPGQEPTGSGD